MTADDQIEKFDIRSVERSIATGKLTREEYEEWLASLPDEGAGAEESGVQMVLRSRPDRVMEYTPVEDEN
jgi:hypothetical protein